MLPEDPNSDELEAARVEEEIYRSELPNSISLPEEIDVREEPQSVFEWMRKYRGGRLITDPDFQRNFVWTPIQRSRFIESILMGIPLPPLYVNQTQQGNYILVDGLQRTNTLYDFIVDGSFALDSSLNAVRDSAGKRFKELPMTFQSRIEDKKMSVYVIKPSVNIKIVYDIFDRINTGGTPLTRQEVRNCYYTGKSTALLRLLSNQNEFHDATSMGIPATRMRDREAILRCIAFQIRPIEDYKNDMDDFLRSTMEYINGISDEEIESIRVNFIRTMSNAFQLFGDRCFRLPTPLSRGRINVAVMETIFVFLSTVESQLLLRNKERINANFSMLLANPDYELCVTRSTGTTSRVKTQFSLAAKTMGEGIC